MQDVTDFAKDVIIGLTQKWRILKGDIQRGRLPKIDCGFCDSEKEGEWNMPRVDRSTRLGDKYQLVRSRGFRKNHTQTMAHIHYEYQHTQGVLFDEYYP